MSYAALERMLVPERFRQRAAPRGGFSTPTLCFMAVEEDSLPILATNARGKFLPTRRNSEGCAPLGFSFCPIGQEGPILNDLYRTLERLSIENGWGIRCTSIPEAMDHLQALGIEPKSLVVSESQMAALLGTTVDLETARRAMGFQGYVSVVAGMQLLLSDLGPNQAFVVGPPAMTGVYMRAGDYLGVQLHRANRSLVLVQPDVA
jgi:hypothetical protein